MGIIIFIMMSSSFGWVEVSAYHMLMTSYEVHDKFHSLWFSVFSLLLRHNNCENWKIFNSDIEFQPHNGLMFMMLSASQLHSVYCLHSQVVSYAVMPPARSDYIPLCSAFTLFLLSLCLFFTCSSQWCSHCLAVLMHCIYITCCSLLAVTESGWSLLLWAINLMIKFNVCVDIFHVRL